MITNRRQKRVPITGSTTWRNPTERHLKIKIWKAHKPITLEVGPKMLVDLPKAWSDATVKKVCKFLVRPKEGSPPDVDVVVNPPPTPAPAAASQPLGDASKVPSAADRKEPGHEDTHSSGDALEAYAQTLMKKPKSALVDLAVSLGIESSGSKTTVARAIARKSIED